MSHGAGSRAVFLFVSRISDIAHYLWGVAQMFHDPRECMQRTMLQVLVTTATAAMEKDFALCS